MFDFIGGVIIVEVWLERGVGMVKWWNVEGGEVRLMCV